MRLRALSLPGAVLCLVVALAAPAQSVLLGPANINYELDRLLSFVRENSYLRKALGNLTFSDAITKAGVTIKDLRLTNLINMYRSGNATLSVGARDGRLTFNASVAIFGVDMFAHWRMHQIIAEYRGDAAFRLKSMNVSFSLSVGLVGGPPRLADFGVNELGRVRMTRLTGAPPVIDSLVQVAVESLANNDWFKDVIRADVNAEVKRIFDQTFKAPVTSLVAAAARLALNAVLPPPLLLSA